MAEGRTIKSRFTSPAALHTVRLLAGLSLSAVACHEGWSAIFKASFSANSSGAGLMAFAAGGYLFWLRRDWLATPGRGSISALTVLFVSALAYYYGIDQRIDVLANSAAILFAFSMICCFLPEGSLGVLTPGAIAFLFAVPIPGIVTEMVSIPMQLFDAAVVEAVAQAVGLPVTRTGTLIAVNGITVDIDQGCDGLRLVWPMLLAAYTAAAIGIAPRWLQITICLSAIPVALVLNCIRLVITTTMYGYASPATAALVHDALGWVMVISAGFLPIVLLNSLVGPLPQSLPNPCREPAVRRKTSRPNRLAPAGVAVATGLLVMTGPLNSHELDPVHDEIVQTQIAALPYRLDRWIGEDRPVPEREREILNADALVQRVYHEPDTGTQLVMLVAYHRDGRLATGHQAPRCYRTRGWGVVREVPFDWSIEELDLDGSIYVMSRNNARMTVFEIFSRPILAMTGQSAPLNAPSSRALMRIQFLVSGEQAYDYSVNQSIGKFLTALVSPSAAPQAG
ncbi:MAG: exosortase/archaeosortase family protein [Proteobacteria bacterium]|nr:exosortase/archaeosortase family protein [Pseudomonadota bacterium]